MIEHQTDSPPVPPPSLSPPPPAPGCSSKVRELVADVVLELSEEGLCVLDRDWRLVHMNADAARLLQRPAEELVGRDARQAFPRAVGAPIHEACREAFATGRPVSAEEYYAPLETWFEARAYPRGDLLVINFRPINQRREAQEALRRSEERFQLAAEATRDVLWDYDFVADELWWSENFVRLLGCAPEEAGTTFASWVEHVHPEDRERAVAAIEEAVRARRPRVAEEYRLRTRDRGYVHVLDRMRFLYDDDGRPRRGVGVLVDVTDQKVAEARQRFLVRAGRVMAATIDYQERLRELARVCCGPLCDYCVVDVIEEDGTVRRIEAAHADPEREGLARDLLRFPPVQERDAGVPMALRTGEAMLVEDVQDRDLQRVAQSPEHLDILRALSPRAYMVVPLRAGESTLGAMVLTLTRPGRRFSAEDQQLARDLARHAGFDIHNARLHRDVERARRAAEEASRAKSQFLAMMSHELRTPLTVMINFADLMASGASGPVTEKQKERIGRMKATAWHLVAMVDEVLAYSRLEAGAELPRLESADVGRIARDVADGLRPRAHGKGLEIHCTVPEEPVLIRSDPARLRQIVSNLLDNAIKFTDRGEVALELDTAAVHRVELRVRDTGPGIAPEDHERVFEPFVQLEDPDTRTHGGTGLGLAITRRFARLLGGEIEIGSERGQGCTFTLRLPA